MTTKDAVLALAAKIAGTTQDNVSTTAQALTKLAYAATGQAPTTDLMTVDDCIAFITANYTPGGGGVDVGAPFGCYSTDTLPAIGEHEDLMSAIAKVKVGTTIICDGGENFALGGLIASGCALTTLPFLVSEADTCNAYVCTVGPDEDYTTAYSTVEAWSGTLTRSDTTLESLPAYEWTFTMPELQEGEILVLHVYKDTD